MLRARSTLPLVSALALGLSAGLAHSADLYAPAPVSDWSGFYAGSLVGYGWTDAEASLSGAPGVTGSDTVDGATGGGVIGYNWQNGAWVFGVEGDITLQEIRGEVPVSGFGPVSVDVDTLYSAHLRGRVGYDMGRFLPYIAGGFTANETYVRQTSTPLVGDNQRLFGWNLGAGVDWKLGQTFIGPVIIRAEYLYESLSDEQFVVGPTMDVEHGTHFIRLGLISYFGGEPAPFNGDVVDWSGAYGGVMVGFSRHNVDTSLPGVIWQTEADGVLGGIYTGRNFQFDRIVVGWEGSAALSDIEGSGQYLGAPSEYRANVQADFRARLGYAFGDVLPFVSAGVLWTRSEQQVAGGGPHDGRVPILAWTVGAGLDYRLSENWSLRGEYLYALDSDASTIGLGAEEQEVEMHQVRFGTAYHF